MERLTSTQMLRTGDNWVLSPKQDICITPYKAGPESITENGLGRLREPENGCEPYEMLPSGHEMPIMIGSMQRSLPAQNLHTQKDTGEEEKLVGKTGARVERGKGNGGEYDPNQSY